MERSVLFWGLEKLTPLKFPYHPRPSTVLMQPLSKYQWHFHRTRTNNYNICKETKKTPNNQNNLIRESFKNKTGRITLQFDVIDFKLYRKVRTGWYGTKTDT